MTTTAPRWPAASPASARQRPDNLPSCWFPRPPRRTSRSPQALAPAGADRATASIAAACSSAVISAPVPPAASSIFAMRSRCNSAKHGPQLAHVGVHRLFLHRELVRGLLDERRPLPEALHVERVAVIAELAAHVLARHLHVDLHLAPAVISPATARGTRAARCVTAHFARRLSSTFGSAGTDSGMGRAAGSSTGTAGQGTAFTAKEKALSGCWLWLWLRRWGWPGSAISGTMIFSLAAAFTAAGCGSMLGAGIGSSIFFSLAVLLVSAGSGSMAGAAAADGSASITGTATRCAGRWPLPSHAAPVSNTPSAFAAGCVTRAYSFASWPLGNCTRKHSIPDLHQFLGQLRGGFVARFVVVVGDVNPLRAVPLERGAMVGCEAVHAVAGRDIPVARNQERQRVDQRLAQDDFLRCDQRLFVPHAPMLAFQVQVVVGVPARRFGVIFRPYISTTSPARLITGITSEPLKCSWPGFWLRRMPSSSSRVRLRVAGGAVLRRQMQPQRAVGEAQPETLDHLRGFKPRALTDTAAPPATVCKRPVVEAHDFQQQLLVLRRPPSPARGSFRTVLSSPRPAHG